MTVATPSFSVPVASTACVTESMNFTVPVGTPSPGGSAITWAVHAVPKWVNAVTVFAWSTVTVTTADCAAGQLESPAHVAEIL